MKKRSLLMAASLVLALVFATTGTLAYLSDVDSDVNVMTLGNVKIDQFEMQRVVKDGEWVSTGEVDTYGYIPDEIEPFEDGQPLYPAYFADGVIKWDDRNGSQNASGTGSHQQSWGQIGASGSNQLFDASVKGAMDKFVFVKNTGSSDAYVRTWFAFEQGSVAADNFENVIMTNSNKDHWSWETVATDVEIGDNIYVVKCATYLGPKSNPTGILAPGAVSYPSLLQVYMRPTATNDDVTAIDGNGNGLYDIMVFSQAVQTNNFPGAETALNAAFGTDHPWGTMTGASTSAELGEAAAAGKDVAMWNDIINIPVNNPAPYGNSYGIAQNGGTIDGNGYTLHFDAPSGDNYGIMTSGGTIKDMTIGGVFRGIMIMNPTEDVIIENVVIGDEDVCYAINTGEGDGKHDLIVKNSTIKGWNSYGTAIKSVSFTDCTFAQGEYYTNVAGRLVKPYVNTVFEGCEFNSKYYIDLSAFEGTTVVLSNCTVNGVKLTADNWMSLIVAEGDCGESQISIEGKDGSYMSSSNVFDYVVIK